MTWATSKQKATVDRILLSLKYTQIHYSTFGRDSAALLTKELLIQSISSSLPNDQWRAEIQEWSAVALARMQHSPVEFITDPAVFFNGMSFITINETDSLALCQAQILRISGEHQSFSVFGLAFTLITGVLITLLSLTIEHIGAFIQTQWLKDRKHKRIQCILDGKLQLLRMVEEYAGKGTWICTAEDIPVSVERTKIFKPPSDLSLESPGLRSSQGSGKLQSMDGVETEQHSLNGEETQHLGRVAVVPVVFEDNVAASHSATRGKTRGHGAGAAHHER